MSEFDLQACDNRTYLQKLTANLIKEYARLQNSVCTEASNRVTELLNVERPVNVCGLASPAILTNIAQGRNTDALDLIFNALNFPPYTAKILTQGGFDNLTPLEKQVVRGYVQATLVRETGELVGKAVEEIIATKVKCPTPARAAQIIQSVNRVKITIQRVQRFLTTLNKILNITYSAISAINTAITATRGATIAADVSLAIQAPLPVGTSGLTARLIGRLENLIRDYKDELKQLEDTVCDASKVVVYIATQLNLLIVFLELVDVLLQRCIQNSEGIQTVEGLDLTTFNRIGTNFRVEYRGYTIEVRTDPNSPAVAPRRFAVALDPVGVAVLTGPPSFSSDTDVLIEELKFRIDNQLG